MYLFLQELPRDVDSDHCHFQLVLLGTFAVLTAFGFSINTLTMFGMVLPIGLLVDDAIVVVENVERVMAEEGLPPKGYPRKSMGQIRGALVGIAMVLCRRYSYRWPSLAVLLVLSIVSSLLPLFPAMALSILVAFILTPALCAMRTEPIAKRRSREGKKASAGFNSMFEKSTHHYTDSVSGILRSTGRYLVLYLSSWSAWPICSCVCQAPSLPDEGPGRIYDHGSAASRCNAGTYAESAQ